LQAILSTALHPAVLQSRLRDQIFRTAVDDSFMFLQNHAWTEENIENDFKGVAAAATLILNETNRNGLFQKLVDPVLEVCNLCKFKSPLFSDVQLEQKSARSAISLRSWNILLLVALREEKEDWAAMLFSHFSAFSSMFASTLRSYATSGISSATVATHDVNQSHIAMKLWLMLSNARSMVVPGGEALVFGTWNELCSAYEAFLDVMDTEAQVGLHLVRFIDISCVLG
jgi:hypothetical protein